MTPSTITLRDGSTIRLPCEVKKGFFPDEALIRIHDEEIKPVVGYVNEKSIVEQDGKKYILALIMGRSNHKEARVFLPGEIISGMNPVTFPITWLYKHL